METTKEYKQFKLLDLNRSLDRRHINNLKKSIQDNGYIGNPILVNENFEIFDGQHRFIALKEMGREVPYEIIGNDYNTIIDLNTNHKNWSITDYINYYCEKAHNQNYIRLRRLCKELKMSPTNVLTMGYGQQPSGQQHLNMKKGILTFTIDNELRARSFNETFVQIAKILRLKASTRLCIALVQLSTRRNFRWETMVNKATNYSTMAYNCRTADEFETMLANIYNFNCRKEELRI